MTGAINQLGATAPWTVTVIDQPRTFKRVVRLVLAGRDHGSPESEQAIQRTIEMRRQGRIPIHAIAAVAANRVISAVLLVESGGDAALVYLPQPPLLGGEDRTLVAILTELTRFARRRGLSLLQVLTASDSVHARLLKDAGFRYLAELIYLERPASAEIPAFRTFTAFDWRCYDERDQKLFVEALALSYKESLDCPGLTGIRQTQRILEGHKATGVYDPSGWFLATCGDDIAGVIITAAVEQRPALEIVYMGVSPAFRGQCVGDALLQSAVEHARSKRQSHLTLAVDAINAPARRLYDRWSFREIARRRAWIVKVSAV